ncbi:MAG: SusD/RagB family nutrient-binding outer membrane lipoprotein [Chitinophagaceae bacterium]|nr:SusD/RagB family nutrient-binding outer membrane lipoprotein [Chitinophagaceae bacterium]
MMKRKIFPIILTAAAFSLAVTGCTKRIDEAYANPNADVRVPVEELLPPIVSCMAANGAGHGPFNDYRFLGRYIQNFAFVNSGDMYDRMSSRLIPLGSTAADMTASIFRMHYYDIGQNCVNMIKWAEEEKKWDYAGVGKAIQAWSWLTLTDVQGEVILKQAFDPARLTFQYDTQEEVYAHVRNLAHQAIAYLDQTGDGASQANLAKGDAFFYNGDVNKWKKFAYAVLARSFNHLTKKANYNADSVIKYCDLAITTNADNAMVKFAYVPGGIGGTANFFGPIRNNLSGVAEGSSSAIRQSTYIVNLLTGNNSAFAGITDPRAIYMIRKNENGTFRGVSPNRGQTAITPATDRPESFWGVNQTTTANGAPGNDNNCRYVFRNAAPAPVIIASEVLFMKAEAALKKNDKATALAAYREGISQHFDLLTSVYNVNIPPAEVITPASKAAYMNAVVPTSAADMNITKIMLQKYISLFVIGMCEVWTDLRRYGYKETDPDTGQQIFRDFVVPSGNDLHPNNLGEPVYRVYPRYNSETIWNIEELKRIGADQDNFHTKKPWFAIP